MALLCAVAPACAVTHVTEGAPLPDRLDALQPGRSTKAEVLALLGPPLELRRQFDGDLLVYRTRVVHTERLLLFPYLPLYERTTGGATYAMVTLLFDEDGVLAGVGRTEAPAVEP